MDYSYRIGVADEDQTLADAVGRFAQAELAPRASERDATEGSVTCANRAGAKPPNSANLLRHKAGNCARS